MLEKATYIYLLLIIATLSTQSPFQRHQEPLDLNYPMKYLNHFERLNPKFYTLRSIQMKKVSDSHFRLDDEIGIFEYKGQKYGIGSADFYSPSLHTISGMHVDMELHL